MFSVKITFKKSHCVQHQEVKCPEEESINFLRNVCINLSTKHRIQQADNSTCNKFTGEDLRSSGM